jgi:heat shock protein HslJ
MVRAVIARALLVAALVVTVPGVGSAQGREPTPEGTRWYLAAYDAGGPELTEVPWDLGASLTFTDGRLFGYAGCQGLAGEYAIDGERLTVTKVGTTSDVGCSPADASIEAAVLAALPKTARWAIDTNVAPGDGSLILFDGQDEQLLVFGSSSTDGLSRQVHDLTALVAAQQKEIKALRARIRELGAAANASADVDEDMILGGSWRRMARGTIAAVGAPGGWTGSDLIVVDPERRRRAAAYDPVADTWRAIAQPPWKVFYFSPAYWTGSELIFVERRGADRRGLAAYDPVADAWRRSAPSPVGDIDASVWADGVIVVASADDHAVAAYDPATDTWTELPPFPEPEPGRPVTQGMEDLVSLYWTGDQVFALTAPFDQEATFTFTPLDLTAGTWGRPSVGPISYLAELPVWTGEAFVFISYPPDASDPRRSQLDGRYDPASDTWTLVEHPCDLETSAAVWTGSIILDVPVGRAFDPSTGRCYRLPAPPREEQSRALRVWTRDEVLEWSGNEGEELAPRRDGIAYRPPK